MSDQKMLNLRLRVWRQPNRTSPGRFVEYPAKGISPDMSFLEMLDVVNNRLILEGEEPIAFDYDCREGICGSCGFVINGVPHGPQPGVATCQLYMRHFKDGAVITMEPWRAKAFPVVKDLVVDRSSFDRIIQSGGYISINAGSAPDANSIPVPKANSDEAFDSAACIGCGACVAACKNASAVLFVGAKITHLSLLPQGRVEGDKRVIAMIERMEEEGFGACSNEGECEAVCPKGISLSNIAKLNREYFRASLKKMWS